MLPPNKLTRITPECPPHDPGYAAFVDDPTLILAGIQRRRFTDENGDVAFKTLYLQVCNRKEFKRIKRRAAQARKSLTVTFKPKRKQRR
jgi:hypothetical protein